MATTEIATLSPLAGTSIGNSDEERDTTLQDCFAPIAKADGYQSFHFGTPFDTPENVLLLVDWDSLQAHQAYAASDAYKPFLELLGKASIDVPKAAYHHVDFQPASSLSKVVNAPITGVTTFYCDGAPGENWLSDAAKAADLMGKLPASSGFLGLVYGITHEELSREGVKGKAGVIFVGWESEEARATCRQTDTFRECLGLLKGEAKAIEVVHVAFKKSAE